MNEAQLRKNNVECIPVRGSAAVERRLGVCVERRDAAEQEGTVMYIKTHKMSRTFSSWALSQNIYHTRGRTLLSQAPHASESILYHEPSPRTIIVTCPICTVYPTDPERSRTPTTELHHSGIMMPRHTIGNPGYETPDLRRPVSITVVSQTAPLVGSRYGRSRTTITNAR